MSPILPLYTQLPTPGHGSDEAEGLLARQAEATVPSYASTGTPSATPTPAVGVAVAPPVYPVPLELSRITLESRSGNTIAQAVGRRGATRKVRLVLPLTSFLNRLDFHYRDLRAALEELT